jgi:hypothetical protein
MSVYIKKMTSLNLNITIENDEVKINGIPIASVNYVDNSIAQIEILNQVQNSVFQPYNGVILSNMFPQELDGVYIQTISPIKAVATQTTIRFFETNNHFAYMRVDGFKYYLLVYLEPATDMVFGNITLPEPAWLILHYTQDPTKINNNIDHYALLNQNTPLLSLVSFETQRFGSQSYPKNPNVEFF